MRSISGGVLVTVLLSSTILSATPASAAETANSQIVIVREDDVITDDLYVGAIRVVVRGRIEGDLIAFSSEEVVIEGSVGGSVMAVSPRVRVDGVVEGSLRAASPGVTVSGRVEGDVVVTAVDVDLEEQSSVGGEVLAWVWTMRAVGAIGALNGTMRSLDLAGTSSGDVDVSVERLRIVDRLEVGGDLGYRSDNQAEGLDLAMVEGVIVDKTPLPPNIRIRGLLLFLRFLLILFLTMTALTVSWGWPEATGTAIGAVRSAPLRNWIRGAVVIFSPVFLVALTALIVTLAPPAAGFPLLAVLIPLIFAVIGAVGAIGLVAGIPAVGWLGSVLFPRLSIHGSLLAGSVIAGVVWLIPVVGWLVPLLVLPLGLGAWFGSWGTALRSDQAVRPTSS